MTRAILRILVNWMSNQLMYKILMEVTFSFEPSTMDIFLTFKMNINQSRKIQGILMQASGTFLEGQHGKYFKTFKLNMKPIKWVCHSIQEMILQADFSLNRLSIWDKWHFVKLICWFFSFFITLDKHICKFILVYIFKTYKTY